MNPLTQQEARAILAPLAHAQWMTAGRMLMPSGVHKERMGSLREVYWFLEPSSRSLPAIDFDRLANWLETALKDKHTAEQVRNASATCTCYVETCKAVYALIGARIKDAEGVLKNDLS